MLRLTLPLFLSTVLVVSPRAAANSCTNLISNGSFETGSVGPIQSVGRPGAANILPWDIYPDGSIDYVNSYWQASDGSRSIDLNGEEAGKIGQDIATQPGEQYTVLFDMSGNPFAGITLKTLTIEAAGTSQAYTYDTSVEGNTFTNMKWKRDLTFTFTATGTTTTIFFSGANYNEAYGPALDNVRVYESDCVGSGGGMGDPHFQTWANEWFDFHGICDLVLVSAPEFSNHLGLQIHIRTKPRYEYSYIEAASIKIGEDVLEVGSFGDYALNGVHNAAMPFTLGSKYTVHHQTVDEKKHIFSIQNGEKEIIVVKTFKDMVSVNVANTNPEDFAHVGGLLGSREGLMLARDGATIIENHDLFGQEWQVKPEDGELFETPSPNKDHCVPPSIPTQQTRRLGEATISEEAATKACANHKDAMKRDMCIFDVMAMGDLEVAEEIHGAF